MKAGLIKETLLAAGAGLAGGILVAAAAAVVVLLRGGNWENLLFWGRAVTTIAGGFGLVYSGLVLLSKDGAERSAFAFHFRLGKRKRTLGDELQPRDDNKRAFFTDLPQKYVGLCVSLGILISSVLVEMLLFSVQ